MHGKMVKRKLREIFELMDSDGDGLVSGSQIQISELSTEVLEAFSPLLVEMEQKNITLSLQMFLDAGKALLNVFNITNSLLTITYPS